MAAAKPEIIKFLQIHHTGQCNFACIPPTKKIPTATHAFSGSNFSTELFSSLWDETGSQKSNMATAKPEVLISQVLGKVDTKFQMLHPHCWGPASQ